MASVSRPRLRSACDRCHSQKLRCRRLPGAVSCARCLKQGTSCVFSPRAPRTYAHPRRTPLGDAVEEAAPVSDELSSHVSPSTTYDTSGMDDFLDTTTDSAGFILDTTHDIASTSNLYDQHSTHCGTVMSADRLPVSTYDLSAMDSLRPLSLLDMPDHAMDFTLGLSTTAPDQGMPRSPDNNATTSSNAPFSMAEAVKQLAELNVKLFDHAATLPPPQAGHNQYEPGSASLDVIASASETQSSRENRLFAIDKTFAFTRTLIGILGCLYAHIDNESAMEATGLSSEFQQVKIRARIPPATLDRGTILLVLSCYHRLMDIYESIFGHMQACIKHSITPISDDGRTVSLPSLQVGSYECPPLQRDTAGTSPPLSAISMHMMVLIMLASQLCDQLRETIGGGMWPENAGHASNEIESLERLEEEVWQTGDDGGTQSAALKGFRERARQAMWNRAVSLSKFIRATRAMLLEFDIAGL
ncbi:hypothetical protein VTN77DRAFT_4674 [Rasamsonia byssochlamydoides]|uniref:uncharacterized protein n=1 Tax=Rasamsonia byssochlamydoides TaxID=89139 RepID=UPI003742202C